MNNTNYRTEYTKKDSALMFVLALLVPSIIVTIVGVIVKSLTDNQTLYYYIMLALNQIVFFAMFLIYNKATKVEAKKANNIKYNLNFVQIVIIIAIGLVAMYGFSSLVNYLEWVLSKIGFNFDSFSYLDISNFGMLMVNILILGVLPAICEELIFRGTILNGLKKYKPATMIVLSGLMFSIFHLSIEQSIYQFILGMTLASIVMITGSIVSSMILHFFNNALVLIVSFITQSQSSDIISPISIWDHILPFVVAIISILLIYILLCLLKKVTKKPMYDIFNFKKQSKVDKNENIDIVTDNVTTENLDKQEPLSVENQNTLQTNSSKKTFFDDFGNVLITMSLGFGALYWILNVIAEFTIKK